LDDVQLTVSGSRLYTSRRLLGQGIHCLAYELVHGKRDSTVVIDRSGRKVRSSWHAGDVPHAQHLTGATQRSWSGQSHDFFRVGARLGQSDVDRSILAQCFPTSGASRQEMQRVSVRAVDLETCTAGVAVA
jgi:hypothetical protein